MNKDRLVGSVLLATSLAGIAVYVYLVFLAPAWVEILVLKLTAVAIVTSALLVSAWIGLTLLVTPPPKPLEDVKEELERQFGRLEARG